MRSGWIVRTALAVSARPSLWAVGLRQLAALAVPGWWRRWPFLPLPDKAYLRFRMQTAYGDPDRSPEVADVLTYLHWCRAWAHLAE